MSITVESITRNSVASIIKDRMNTRLKNLYSTIAILLSYGHTGYYVAGNSCNADKPNDFDIYPDNGGAFDFDDIISRVEALKGYVVCNTRNALTVNMSGTIGKKIYLDGFAECRKGLMMSDELKRFLALWENAVCEIRAENKASSNNIQIAHLCDKLESSMVAYAKGNVEYAHFAI